MERKYNLIDRLLMEFNEGLTTILGHVRSSQRLNPSQAYPESALAPRERKQSERLMRVDHTGEVCAQALYRGQMFVSHSAETQAILSAACDEEKDHLAWTHQRLQELKGRRSYLNVYWYIHSFFIGMMAGLCGDRWSLGFVEETEKQVSRHLTSHLEKLSVQDVRSRKIIAQMRADEERHGQNALNAGGLALPLLIKQLMTLQSKVMTALTYYL